MSNINNQIINFFNNQKELSQTNQNNFWNQYLSLLIHETLKGVTNKKNIQDFIPIFAAFNININKKQKDKESLINDLKQQTEQGLLPYLMYSYFNLQYNNENNFDFIYQHLIQIKNDEIGTKTLYYCFDKIIKLTLFFNDKWPFYAIDVFLAYCIASWSLLPTDYQKINNDSGIVNYLDTLQTIDFFKSLKTQNLFIWDIDTKKEIINQIINCLPIKIKKKRYIKLLNKKINNF